MRTGGAVSQGLCYFGNMEQSRPVGFPHFGYACFISFHQGRIIPSTDHVNIHTSPFIRLKTGQRLTDALFGSLVFFGNRNTIAVIPNTKCYRDLQYAGRVHGFPANAFRSGGVTNRTKHYFIPVAAEFFSSFNAWILSVYSGGKAKANSPGHLAGGGG